MEKPRIFISAVTRELASARQRVANILTRKGYEPVWQDIFGTEPGDLRDMLREKINSCAGLIQITGDACGFEPADPDSTFGRCSYTQFEFLYALQKKKKTWLLLAGPDVLRDHPLTDLDLPPGPHPDSAAYQQERRELQRLYKERPEFQQHLRHTAESDLALDLATERLDDELTALRAEWQQWQQKVTHTLTESTRRQRTGLRLAVAGLTASGFVLGGIWWLRRDHERLATGVTDKLDHVSEQIAERKDSLDDLIKRLDEIKLERAAAGKNFRDLTKADLERLLAEKAAITVQELRRRITAGEQSADPLERARALLLQGDFDAALKETSELEKTRTADLVAVLTVKSQAHDGKFQYNDALAARQKIAVLTDKEKDPAAWATAQHMVAYSLNDLGKAREVEPILRDVIVVRERVLGSEDANTLVSRNNLAIALGEQGKFAESEAQHRSVIAIQSRTLSPEHPDTLQSRNNLATALHDLGKYSEAEAEHRAVLAISERVLGHEHPTTLASRSNLANTLRAQGKNKEAEMEHRAVLAVRERVLGPEHPDTLASRNNLAITPHAGWTSEEAEAEHRAVLAVRARVLGPEHPDTLASRNNIANALRAQGKCPESEAEFRAVLAIQERVLGPEHPDTLRSRNSLALTLLDLKQNTESEMELRDVIAICERVLGPEHPDTLASRNSLGLALRAQGKYAGAEAEHRAVLAVQERVPGPDHADTLGSRDNLATALWLQGKRAEVETLHRISLAARERMLGPEHPDTLKNRGNLAAALQAQGKNEEAAAEHRARIIIEERVLGADNPETQQSHGNLSLCLELLGNGQDSAGEKDTARAQWQEALDHARTALDAGMRVFSKDHPLLARFKQQVTRLEARLKQ